MTSNPFIVKLDRVDVEIGRTPILHGISLEIARGGHLGVVGGNGSGKSTLLALIAGRRWPTPGRGRRLYDFGQGPETDAITARSCIALIGHELQDTYLARRWNFRARDVVLSGLTRSDIPRRRVNAAQISEAEALLESMRLEKLADRRLLELSRGEQRRVLIARALAFRPTLLLLDEPFSGLDTTSQERLAMSLAKAAERVTIVIAAHHASELPQLLTRVVKLNGGRLDCAPASVRGATKYPEDPRVDRRSRPLQPAVRDILIELQHASVWLDGRPVLKDLDWQLAAGECWLVEGPNGAGKSTLLRLLHGELRPAVGGRISWPGLGNPPDVWKLRRRIALVSPELQARYLYPTTVFNAVASGFRSSIGVVHELTSEQTERLGRLLDAFRLDALRDRLLSSLSYGQRHRALIARTLVTRPRVVLLDEPWAGLDTDTARLIRDEMNRRIAAGTSVVCVSHVGTRGLALNRTLKLDAGRMLSVGGSGGPRGNSASVLSRAADYRPR